jgi:Tol biopolymer transport system component
MPLFGGAPQSIVRNLSSDITFAPGGKQIAYLRANDPGPGKWSLFIANADGTGETSLSSDLGSNRVDYVWPPPGDLSWSPDGTRIAAAVTRIGSGVDVDVLDVKTRQRQRLVHLQDKAIRSLAWFPDGRGLLVNDAESSSMHHWQIGFLSLPGGNFFPLTNDPASYLTHSMSSDGRSFAAVQSRLTRQLYLLPAGGSSESSPAPVTLRIQSITTFSWDFDGKLFIAGDGKLSRVTRRGEFETALLNTEGVLQVRAPTPCEEGRRLVFEWDYRGGSHDVNVWRADADGSNLVQLTRGADGEDPVCSPDGKWVYYVDNTKPQPWRVPLEGGQAEVIPGSTVEGGHYSHGNIALSPRGDQLVYLARVKTPAMTTEQPSAVIVDLRAQGRNPPKLVAVDPRISYPPQFTPDGKSLAYPIDENGVDNIWLQPLDGSAKRRITNFSSDSTRVFYWSPDGKTLGILRSRPLSDVVLFRQSSAGSRESDHNR